MHAHLEPRDESNLTKRMGRFVVIVTLSIGATFAAEAPWGSRSVISVAADDPQSVFAADVDRDGDMDLLSASSNDDKIAWYENDGASPPTWTARTISSAADGAWSVVAADVDGDGDVDVLSASSNDDKIAWYENDGARSVVAADVDGDGDVDVLSASSDDDTIAWYENDGASPPAWTARTISSAADGARSVFAADVDRDGDVDVLSASFNDDRITWYENDGASPPAWTARTISSAADGAQSVSAADVDGDGDVDALSASSNDDRIAWYENDGASPPVWTAHTVTVSAIGAESVVAADMDLDGDADALSASFNDNRIVWYENDGTSPPAWTPRTISTAAAGARSAFAADVDGDGDVDALSASSDDDTIAWYENESIHRSAPFSGLFGPEDLTGRPIALEATWSLAGTDLDGDGDTDLLATSFVFPSRILWYENLDGLGSFGPKQEIATINCNICEVSGTDVDGDGDSDFVFSSNLDEKIEWYENLDGAGNFGPGRTITTSAGEVWSVFAADVDGDGDADVLSGVTTFPAAPGDTFDWYENLDGAGGFGPKQVIATVRAQRVSAADMDGDGDLDALSASNYQNDHLAWYENVDGAGSFGPPQLISSEGVRAFQVVDLDGDDDPDVLAGLSPRSLVWYENLGQAGSFGPARAVSPADDVGHPTTVCAADVDGDGDQDALVAAQGDGKAAAGFSAWYENLDGAGNFGPKQLMGPTFLWGSAVIVAADVDDDGDTDAFVSSPLYEGLTRALVWWENRGGQFALPTLDTAPGQLQDGAKADLLQFDVVHNGRIGDNDLELATLELLLEEEAGDPLTDAEADALIEELSVFLDDGSGVFEDGSDTLVASASSFSLTAGVQTFVFPDGDPPVRVEQGSPKTFFVVLELADDAAIPAPGSLRVTHLTESSSTAEDRDHDIPLLAEFTQNTSSATVAVIPSSGAVPDGDDLPGTPLTLGKSVAGLLDLFWGDSCGIDDVDYAVYEGLLGDFDSHRSKVCGTGGTSATVFMGPIGNYYLVAPLTTDREGSLGTDSAGNERPPGALACSPRLLGSCSGPPS